jgi:hypothetical protein
MRVRFDRLRHPCLECEPTCLDSVIGMERGRPLLNPAIGSRKLCPQSLACCARKARERVRAQMRSNLFDVFMMSRLKRRAELLRE